MTEKPTVSEVLFNAFGSDFSEATQRQRLLLLEAVAFSLRSGRSWRANLDSIRYDSRYDSPLPESIFIRAEITTNEGLKLMAILNVAIVEGYSVLAASERLHT